MDSSDLEIYVGTLKIGSSDLEIYVGSLRMGSSDLEIYVGTLKIDSSDLDIHKMRYIRYGISKSLNICIYLHMFAYTYVY